ncbi:hypothetical protein CEXT_359121 [Caerostris extrusa]|uniref:Uncharacterized protein n=1 Tax=Caerostris extrusa TaxID=172846 RepID=A0AAV4XQW1_CAEEX|nr:hypothetical protein CEXT_359121 [Caerostris extrusa]
MSIFAGVASMMQMEVTDGCYSPEGVPLLGAEANVSTNVPKKASPEDTCRQLVTAKKEMKILDDIIATTKNSDLQSDYDQMNANLMQKRQLLAKWASRVPCPLANCNIHHSNVKKSKRPVDELTNQNDKTNAS